MSRGNRIAVDAGWSEQCGLFFWRPPDWLAVLRDSELRAVRADDRSGGLQPNTYPTLSSTKAQSAAMRLTTSSALNIKGITAS